MPTAIQAPWTAEQVEKLNEYQDCDWVHEFTCPNRGDRNHMDTSIFLVGMSPAESGQIDPGKLIARLDGFHCYYCGYHQTWAWDFMFHGAPPKPPFPRVVP